MAEEVEKEEQPEVDYIAALTELREKTVPKEQYAQLKEENAKLLRSLIDGETIEGVNTPTQPDISQLRKDLFGGDDQITNLDYVAKALELRDALIEDGKPDPFLPIGHQVAPTQQDVEAANRVAKVMRECVEEADGDSNLFTSLLMRNTVDTPMPRARK